MSYLSFLVEACVLAGLLSIYILFCRQKKKLNSLTTSYLLATTVAALSIASNAVLLAGFFPSYAPDSMSRILDLLVVFPCVLIVLWIPTLLPCGVLAWAIIHVSQSWKLKVLGNPAETLPNLANDQGNKPVLVLTCTSLFLWLIVSLPLLLMRIESH